MPREQQTEAGARSQSSASMRHALGLLIASEIGQWPKWIAAADEPFLRMRVALLAILGNVVPRSEIDRLEEVVASWNTQFPKQQFVPIAKLHETSRDLLKLPEDWSLQGYRDFSGLRRAMAITHCSIDLSEAVSAPVADVSLAEAERQCAFGLGVWLDQLGKNRRWRFLPAVVPGEAPAAIDQVYVELFAIADQTLVESENGKLERSGACPGGC